MRTKHWSIGAVMALAVFGASGARAQVTGGGVAAPTTGGATAATGATAAAGAEAAPGFFKKACMALEECKRKLCLTAAGQLINSMTAPISAMTGGVIPPFCPIMPSAKDLAKEGTEGAAANAKKDALEAKERVKAVRYLGTLDCRYYPEAELALIAALRMDRVECVRWEAAMAFGRGCCCTKKVMEALEISVSGSERDGNPAERSPRVRDAAAFALDRCLACYQEPLREVDGGGKDIKDPPLNKDGTLPNPKVTNVEKDRQMIERARHTVATYGARREMLPQSTVASKQTVLPHGQRSLFHIIRFGTDGPSQPVAQPMTQVARHSPQSNQMWTPRETPAPRELPRVDSVATRPAPSAQPKENLTIEPTVERKEFSAPPPAVATTPQSDFKVYDVKPSQPQENVRNPVVTPTDKAVAPMAVEPMDPTPAVTIHELPAERVEKPAAPMTTVQPAPQATVTPASIEKPVANETAISVLIDSMLTGSTADDRHQAIRGIVSHDWRKYPQIVAALVKTARLDSDRTVRVNAIRHLAHLKIDVPYVFDHLKYMEKDQDSWVQQESTLALEKLGK